MKPHTILVVEDNPLTRKMLRVTLESGGYQVVEAGDGRSGLAALALRRPSLVVVDYVLPDTDGLRLLAEIRRQTGAPELPALLVTGRLALEELRGESEAVTHFLPKPVEPSRLLEVVAAHLCAAEQGGRGRKILLVDDEPLNLKLASLHLQNKGYEVETAHGAEEGLEKARRRAPDAILADVLMPVMDGFAFCAEVRRDPLLAAIPIVLFSSFVDDADRELARRMGANALVTRTPDFRESRAALEEILRGGQHPPAPSAGDEVAALHRERLQIQLERQKAQNETLLREAAIHSTTLAVMSSLSEVLTQPQDVPRVIGELLVQCLNAAGLSTGLLYILEPGNRYRLEAHSGVPVGARQDAESCFGHPEIIGRIVESSRKSAYLCVTPGADPETRDFLARLGRPCALIVPFVVLGQDFGVLVLTSDTQDLAEDSWVGFGHSLAVQFGQTVALGQSLTRLAASEKRYRALMEQANDAILILDPPQRIVEANREAERLLGRPREEILERRYDDFVVPDELEDSARRAEVLLSEGTVRIERHLLRADGTRAAVEVSAALVRLGEESKILVILHDITERQRSEAALREAQQRLQHVVSSSPAVLFTLGVANGQIAAATWVSDNIERLTGDSAAEALAPDWWLDRLHPDDRGMGLLPSLLAQGSAAYEARLRHKRGDYLWIRSELRVVHDASGEPVEVVGSWSDVTARKEMELKLQQSEVQYRLLFDYNPQPMMVCDDETLAFLAVNEAAVCHYGYARAEFLAMSAHDICLPEEVRLLVEERARLDRAKREVFHSVRPMRHRTRDGRLLDVDVAASPIEFRRRRAWLVLAHDVTEKMRLEAQFLQAQKMESVGRLAGGVAHDFNNLLTLILGYGSLLLGPLADRPELRRRVEEILRAGESAATLTRQLLAFSRRQLLVPEILDLNALIRQLQQMLRRLIREDIELVTDLGEQLGRIRADAGQMEQVIMNLVINSRDAMPHGGKITIHTRNEPAAEGRTEQAESVVLSIRDTGAGMDSSILQHVFEPFFTTKEEGKGTGLGLAMVYGIVHQSGGRITVESQPGEGAAFTVYLPRTEEAASPSRPPDRLLWQRGYETILLAEDAAQIRELAREILAGCGYVVLVASGTAEALALADRHIGPIHLLLTDVIMPGASGVELGEWLSARRPGLRVLYMSGYTSRAVQPENLRPGVGFVQKPFKPEALAQKVREALDGPAAS
ncbi:MAG TPA: response regulator [Thermoanaerobaculia bacterium]|nr:response regulator [Thermoanaerobaculia bacterium]